MLNRSFHLAFIGPGGPELLVVVIVLIMVFGAKDAPKILRKINEILNSIRTTAEGFRREIMYADLNDESSSEDRAESSVDDDYEEYHDDDYDYPTDDDERNYSDETFQDLEKDLEDASAESVAEESAAVQDTADAKATSEEDDHAEKA
ncbi:MAG: hypothetical protein V5783_09880 [Pontiella sp.]